VYSVNIISFYKKLSYHKQIAHHHSCHKNSGQVSGHGWPCENFPFI